MRRQYCSSLPCCRTNMTCNSTWTLQHVKWSVKYREKRSQALHFGLYFAVLFCERYQSSLVQIAQWSQNAAVFRQMRSVSVCHVWESVNWNHWCKMDMVSRGCKIMFLLLLVLGKYARYFNTNIMLSLCFSTSGNWELALWGMRSQK